MIKLFLVPTPAG